MVVGVDELRRRLASFCVVVKNVPAFAGTPCPAIPGSGPVNPYWTVRAALAVTVPAAAVMITTPPLVLVVVARPLPSMFTMPLVFSE